MSGPAEFTVQLVDGFALLVAASGHGFVYPADNAGPDDVPIYAMVVPETPAVVATVSPYPLTADATQAMSVTGIQWRFRSADQDPRPVWRMKDAVGAVMLGHYPLTLPSGVHISTLEFANGGSLGQDVNGRWLWADSYRAEHYQPGPYRK